MTDEERKAFYEETWPEIRELSLRAIGLSQIVPCTNAEVARGNIRKFGELLSHLVPLIDDNLAEIGQLKTLIKGMVN